MAVDLSAKLSSKIYATDSSDRKGAVTSTEAPVEVARVMHRAGARKPGYHRMLRRDEALRQKIDDMYEPDEAQEANEGGATFPEKPLAMKYHFIEVCGGAGKIAGCLESHGWKVGPVIDIERSPHFDLSFLTVLTWIYHLLEQGRLDGCLIAPPCTTFSPAAHPCLRSYKCPRGFNPSHPRTRKGTELALRALSILFLCHRIKAICLIEQPRRSKMAWLREWVRMLDFFGARETWLASCNFDSPHQKEFRLLGVNLEIHKLHHPCTRDHTHLRIEGRYTKPSATYTDALASRIADVIDEALSRKLRIASHHLVRVGGLESPIVNDISTSLCWKVDNVWSWRKPSHINIQEATAYGRLVYHLAQCSPKTRFSACLDSHVALAAIAKGRSPSHGLRPTLRRISAATVAGCLYPALHFVPTRLNPADHPTRDHAVPEPRGGSFLDTEFSHLVSLTELNGLRRFAANWVRLFLLVSVGFRRLKKPDESWRFSHYHESAYPYAWTCSRVSDSHDSRSHSDFDSSLGFPGEGPAGSSYRLVVSLALWTSATLFVPYSSEVHGLLSLFCLLFVKPPVGFGFPLLIFGSASVTRVFGARADPSHGQLRPRSSADRCRADRRKGLELDDGRPVLDKTKKERARLLEGFSEWLVEIGTNIDELLDPRTLDIEAVNLMLERFGRQLYLSGRPYNHYAETINAVASKRPSIRRVLQGAWDLAYTWLREEPPVHHVALPWPILLAAAVTSSLWGWFDVAAILCLSRGGLTRIGEALKAKRKHLVLPRDVGWTSSYILLQIEEPKTRFKAARHQVARVDQPQLTSFIDLIFGSYDSERYLWPASPQTLRGRFQKILKALNLDALPNGLSRGLDLGSLRAGGASWLLMVSEDSELVRRRGRWINHKIMEVYVQEVAALQFLPRLDVNTRNRILLGANLFPLVLSKLTSFISAGIPEVAWRILLVSNDAMTAEDGSNGRVR